MVALKPDTIDAMQRRERQVSQLSTLLGTARQLIERDGLTADELNDLAGLFQLACVRHSVNLDPLTPSANLDSVAERTAVAGTRPRGTRFVKSVAHTQRLR